MVTVAERNLYYMPIIESEGKYAKPLPIPPGLQEGKWWYAELKPYERVHYHHTLSSARRYTHFRPFE